MKTLPIIISSLLISIPLVNAEVIKQELDTSVEVKDAKRATRVDIMTSIHNPGDYEVRVDCSKTVFIGEGRCEVSPGRYMEVKVTKKNALPGQGGSKTRVYKVTAHNNNSAYICDKKGAIKRGYAATFEDILYGEVEYMADVCTTVAVVGQTDTRSTIVVTEKKSGLYIKFENAGQHWKSVGSFPDESKEVAVNFDEVRKG